MVALKGRHFDVVDLLIEARASPNQRDTDVYFFL